MSTPTRASAGRESKSEIASWVSRCERLPVAQVPVASLLPAHTPRLSGADREHVRALAESDVEFPPIIVHRGSRRVIDGTHRLHAAALRAKETIDVRFFDGDEADAFVLSVFANITHGLPLSLADRKAAATRIVGSHAHWSDRVVGWITGLSHKTVGAIRRRCATGENTQSHRRMGQDGRIRPLNCADGRRLASELIRGDPGASLRQVAKAAGVSTSTVRDVRDRLRRGDDPVPARLLAAQPAAAAPMPRPVVDPADEPAPDHATIMRTLRNDPMLRFTESGRLVLRWLEASVREARECEQLADKIPAHCSVTIARVAMVNAMSWHAFARQLELRHDF